MKIRVLGKDNVKQVLSMRQVIEGVSEVYKTKARGETVVGPMVSHDFEDRKEVMAIRSGYIKGNILKELLQLKFN